MLARKTPESHPELQHPLPAAPVEQLKASQVTALILADFKHKPGFYLLYVVFVSGVHTHPVAD